MRTELSFVLRLSSVTALIGVSIVACSGNDAPKEKYLGLEELAPSQGFQVRSIGADVPAGQDVEYCEIAELPGDPSQVYTVNSIEAGNGHGSHHLIISAAVPGSEADQKVRALPLGQPIPCLGASQEFGAKGMQDVFGIQQPYGRIDFPQGIGREYHGGQRIVFDYHYLNTTSETVHARSAVNFHTTDPANVQQIADGFGFYNWTIDTPPHETRSFKGECHFKQDVKVGSLTRHTHRWGTNYTVWRAGGEHDGERVWLSKDWEHDVDLHFAEPLTLKAGEGFRFECSFDNTEDYRLRFGTQARDEMCILFGVAWDANGERVLPSQDCGITWTDQDGVGHPASEDGGFPAPPEELKNLCLANTPDTDCMNCYCENCATVLVTCSADPDCNAILQCFREKSGDCQSAVDAHSSAAGMAVQVQSCVESKCPAACRK